MSVSAEPIVQSFLSSVNAGEHATTPYDHWNLHDCLPEDAVDDILGLPFETPDLEGVSGKRELHNATRTYFDIDNRKRYPVVEAVAQAFQDKRVTDRITNEFNTDIEGAYLRIEFAQDTNGFWLEPHSDLGVKLFTMLLYMSKDESHADLGTDIYDQNLTPVARSPFASNSALVFIPSGISFHGFESRPIEGIRKSIIINYVTDEWRAREQLTFPEAPIS
jgi:hypothetical protein